MSSLSADKRVKHLQTTGSYYSQAFETYGPTALGVDWASGEGQQKRFRTLDLLWANEQQASLCDFGCGYGAYALHVRQYGFTGFYTGVDLSLRMIQHARSEYGQLSDTLFQLGARPLQADFVVASGIFNVVTSGSRSEWAEHAWELLGQMCLVAKIGVGFNMLIEPSVPYRDREKLFWANPEEVCERLRLSGHRPRVVAGYGLHEATYLTRREIHCDD